ncbi:hypothetical protein EI013_24525 [Escherichia coli]|nr:hypothetical protein [Escherichia coli]
MASLKVACLVLMCMAVVSAPIAQAITCGQVVSSLSACIGYLTSGGPVPGGCCGGVKNLLALSPTPADRKTACNCLKQAAKNIPRYNDQNAESLPGKCGVNIPYKISTSTNCATIKF